MGLAKGTRYDFPSVPEELWNPQEALRFAQLANRRTGSKNRMDLATLALAYHRAGQTDKAIETQRQALSQMTNEDPFRPEYERYLAEYEAAMRAGGR